MDKNEYKEGVVEKLGNIEDATDDIRNTTENIYDELSDSILAYNRAVEEVAKIQRGFAIASFVAAFLVSFGVGLALNGKQLTKFIKKLK